MGSTTVRDVLFRVSTQLHDITPQFTRWTERELVAWLNDGQRAIAKYMPHSCSRVDSIRLKPGTKQSIEAIGASMIIPGDGSAATAVNGMSLLGVTRNMGADGQTPGGVLRIVDREVLDSVSPTWHTKTGTPNQYTFDPRTPKVFYVSPGVPSTSAYWVEASYLAAPVTVSGSGYGFEGSNPELASVDDTNIDDLVNYILARAYMKDAEFAEDASLAQAHTSLFTSSINAQVAALTGVNPNLQSLPLNPAIAAASK